MTPQQKDSQPQNTIKGNYNVQLSDIDANNVAARDIINIYNQSPKRPVTSPRQIPALPGDYTGRDAEFKELVNKIESDAVVIVVHGAGGIGKSTLSYKLANHLADRYPCQIYMDLMGTDKSPIKPADAMGRVIRAWDKDAELSDDDAELAGDYRSILKENNALLLFDNAADRAQVDPLIPPTNCLMLVTARNHFVLAGSYNKNLEEMQPDDARDLVVKIAGLPEPEAAELAKICGYMPQAIRVAASSLKESPNITPDKFFTRLKDRKHRPSLVEGVFDVSYELMKPELQSFWRTLGIFPGTFEDAGAAAVWKIPEDETQNILARLLRKSMVEFDIKTSRYRLHDLARDFAILKLPAKELDNISLSHAVHYAKLAGEADNDLDRGGESYLRGLDRFDIERHNIEAGQKWACENQANSKEAAKLCIDYALRCPRILGLRLHPQILLDWMKAAYMSAKKLEDKQIKSRTLGNLGTAYANLGDYDSAEDCSKKALKISIDIKDREVECDALGNLGKVYGIQSKYDCAIVHLEKALAIAREKDREKEGLSLFNLGIIHYRKADHNQAIKFFKQALAIFNEIGEKECEAAALHSIGDSLLALGSIDEALESANAALKISERIKSPNLEIARALVAKIENQSPAESLPGSGVS